MRKGRFKKNLFIILGCLSLGLGIIGVFIPLLPTTPFLLLSAALFFRSSDRLYLWLIQHRIFGRYIRTYREYRAVSIQVKVSALAILWSVISFSALVVLDNWWLRALLLCIALGVTLHILKLRTLTKEMLEEIEQKEPSLSGRNAENLPES